MENNHLQENSNIPTLSSESTNYTVDNKKYVVNSFYNTDEQSSIKDTIVKLITNEVNNNI